MALYVDRGAPPPLPSRFRRRWVRASVLLGLVLLMATTFTITAADLVIGANGSNSNWLIWRASTDMKMRAEGGTEIKFVDGGGHELLELSRATTGS